MFLNTFGSFIKFCKWSNLDCNFMAESHCKSIKPFCHSACVKKPICRAFILYAITIKSKSAINNQFRWRKQQKEEKKKKEKYMQMRCDDSYHLPNITTFSGSTQMSLQNCSIASGPSTSGSWIVVYCLNQLRQRLLLNPSSILFVRLELLWNERHIK